ncbi:ADP-ribosyl cyclase/cyclic ADP-ribose hydrolase 1 [Erpetoichthys calabaricus]|uniref:ADP-ribosyl cyclase/cyclic ADP-ribose hydrolase n=1 Tax=Erpetoichthys calabaricus TaxID=27687 RepID=A0A8C4RQP0_ERPCA|nr:ADP-ribosyl cyclase/cyclic ADP-ribose hydrolase 1 [Erpetoichthys calabaricus]
MSSPRRASSRRRNPIIVLACCLLVILVFVVALILVFIPRQRTSAEGTSKNLADIIVRRCRVYVQEHESLGSRDCEEIKNRFLNSVIGKDPCNITMNDYDFFMEAARQNISCNKFLFWSKTKEIAHFVSSVYMNINVINPSKCVMTLEDSLVGYMMDGLKWCSRVGMKEMDYSSCPGWNDCELNSVKSFWKRASLYFASIACGNVSVMLNGSISDPFSDSSLFANTESRKLNSKNIDEVNILLVDSPPDRNMCESSSIRELRSVLSGSNIRYKCTALKSTEVKQCISSAQSCNCF